MKIHFVCTTNLLPSLNSSITVLFLFQSPLISILFLVEDVNEGTKSKVIQNTPMWGASVQVSINTVVQKPRERAFVEKG